jgi:hypothetical protein
MTVGKGMCTVIMLFLEKIKGVNGNIRMLYTVNMILSNLHILHFSIL